MSRNGSVLSFSSEPQQVQFSCRNEEMKSYGVRVAMIIIKCFKKTKPNQTKMKWLLLFVLHFQLNWLSDIKWLSFPIQFFQWQVLSEVWIEEERKREYMVPRVKDCLPSFRTFGECAFLLLVLYFYVFLCEARKRWGVH